MTRRLFACKLQFTTWPRFPEGTHPATRTAPAATRRRFSEVLQHKRLFHAPARRSTQSLRSTRARRHCTHIHVTRWRSLRYTVDIADPRIVAILLYREDT